MNKVLKNIVNKTIENEFFHVQEEGLKYMDDIKEYDQIEEKYDCLYHELKQNLPKEMHDILDEFNDKRTELLCLEIKHYFKQGVKAGLTNLKYLEEAGEGIYFL